MGREGQAGASPETRTTGDTSSRARAQAQRDPAAGDDAVLQHPLLRGPRPLRRCGQHRPRAARGRLYRCHGNRGGHRPYRCSRGEGGSAGHRSATGCSGGPRAGEARDAHRVRDGEARRATRRRFGDPDRDRTRNPAGSVGGEAHRCKRGEALVAYAQGARQEVGTAAAARRRGQPSRRNRLDPRPGRRPDAGGGPPAHPVRTRARLVLPPGGRRLGARPRGAPGRRP